MSAPAQQEDNQRQHRYEWFGQFLRIAIAVLIAVGILAGIYFGWEWAKAEYKQTPTAEQAVTTANIVVATLGVVVTTVTIVVGLVVVLSSWYAKQDRERFDMMLESMERKVLSIEQEVRDKIQTFMTQALNKIETRVNMLNGMGLESPEEIIEKAMDKVRSWVREEYRPARELKDEILDSVKVWAQDRYRPEYELRKEYERIMHELGKLKEICQRNEERIS